MKKVISLVLPVLTLLAGCHNDDDNDLVFAALSVTETIVASEGGEMTSSDGALDLSIPAGALAEDTEITITRSGPVTVDDGDGGELTFSESYTFEPDGLTFSQPVEVTFRPEPSASNQSSISEDGEVTLRASVVIVAHIFDEQVLPLSNSIVQVTEQGQEVFTGEISHFSTASIRFIGDSGISLIYPDQLEEGLTDGITLFTNSTLFEELFWGVSSTTSPDLSLPGTDRIDAASDAEIPLRRFESNGQEIACTNQSNNPHVLEVFIRAIPPESPSVLADFALTWSLGGLIDCIEPSPGPDPFSFPPKLDVTPGELVESEAITITGFDSRKNISIDVGEYSVRCDGEFTSEDGFMFADFQDDRIVCVRHTAALGPNETVTSALTIGSETGTFSSTTRSDDSTDCENFSGIRVVRFDLGASGSGIPGITAGEEIGLNRITDYTDIQEPHIGKCPYTHLHGDQIFIDGAGPYAEPDRSDGPDGERSCGHGEVFEVEICIDPFVPGEIRPGIHSIGSPKFDRPEGEPVRLVSIMSQISASQPASSASTTSVSRAATPPPQDVEFVNTGALTGPIIGTNINYPGISVQTEVVDMFTGDSIRSGLSTGGDFQLSLARGVPGPSTRTITVNTVSDVVINEFAPDLGAEGETIFHHTGLPSTTDISPFGFGDNFTGQGEGIVLAHPQLLSVVAFVDPPADNTFFEDRFQVTVYRPEDFPDISGLFASGAASATLPSPDLLVVTDGSPAQLWHVDDGVPALIEDIGDSPERIRCLDATICAVTHGATSDNLTLISWDGDSAPNVVQTATVGDNPFGLDIHIDVNGDFHVATVGSDGMLGVTKVAANGTVLDNSVTPVPAGCSFPEDPVWFNDTASTKLAIPCPGNVTPGGNLVSEFMVVDPFQ